MAVTHNSIKPWFREPWPWLLMAGPAVVIVAGIVTAWLAVSSSDGLVAEEYYKKGLAAGETLARSRHAEELGLQAGLKVTDRTLSVRLSARQAGVNFPETLLVTVSHPTRAGLDQTASLTYDGERYVGDFRLPASGHWLVLIEDEGRTWRLMGSVVLPSATETVLDGTQVAEKPKL